MLTLKPDFLTIAEVNPPALPDHTHHSLEATWSHVLVTDNVFGRIRVSPYAYGARITHDLADVHPTVVVSTRDRNELAIESEVRGALGNGVDSFLVVTGDTFPTVDQLATPGAVVAHLRALQSDMPAFEVGSPTRFDRRQIQRRVDAGAQFLVTVPVVDPAVMRNELDRLCLDGDDPPVYVAVIPPFSAPWITRAEGWGALPASPELRARLEGLDRTRRRAWAWQQVEEIRAAACDRGVAGVIVMGLKFETVVGEAAANLAREPEPRGVCDD